VPYFSSEPEDLDWLLQVCLIRVGDKLGQLIDTRAGLGTPDLTEQIIE